MVFSFLRRWWPLAAVAALLALAALAASHSSVQLTPVDRGPGAEPGELAETLPTKTAPTADPTDHHVPVPDWLFTATAVFCALVAVGVIGGALWMLLRDLLRRRPGRSPLRRRRRRPDRLRTGPETAEEVVAALDAGLVDLSDSDADPRRAVIACWVRLEQAAESAGMPRQVGDTPTDLVTRLLAGGRPVSADVLAAFADVYREARYATHTVDERMRQQARDALRRLRAELTTEVGT